MIWFVSLIVEEQQTQPSVHASVASSYDKRRDVLRDVMRDQAVVWLSQYTVAWSSSYCYSEHELTQKGGSGSERIQSKCLMMMIIIFQHQSGEQMIHLNTALFTSFHSVIEAIVLLNDSMQ